MGKSNAERQKEWRERHPEVAKERRNATSRKRDALYRKHIAELARSLGKDPRVCVRCKKETGRKKALHWHHIDPATKLFNIGDLGSGRRRTDEEILRELAKCERVCKPCHSYHHSVGGRNA